MKKVIVFFILAASISCHKEQLTPNTCGVKKPFDELAWLPDRINRFGGDITVYQALHQGQTIFSIDSFLGADAGVGVLYRCDGSVICRANVTFGGVVGDCGNIDDQLTDYVVIYSKKR